MFGGGPAVAVGTRAKGSFPVTPAPLVLSSMGAIVVLHCGIGKPSGPVFIIFIGQSNDNIVFCWCGDGSQRESHFGAVASCRRPVSLSRRLAETVIAADALLYSLVVNRI